MVRRISTLAGFIAPLLALVPRVAAQSTTAVCNSTFSWMNNDKNQSPCLVAAWLISPCLSNPQTAIVLPLDTEFNGQNYYAAPGPGLLAATACTCNTVLYSMLSACGTCQEQTFVSWNTWEATCSAVYTEAYPETIPSAISVPQWAYLGVSSTGFNVANAEALAAEHEPDATGSGNTSAGVSSTSGSGSPTNANTAATGSPTGTPASNTNNNNGNNNNTASSKKKAPIGAIVGGVVGGVVALALIGGLLWFLFGRKKQPTVAVTPAAPAADGNGFNHPGYAPVPIGTPDIEKPAYTPAPSDLHSNPETLAYSQYQNYPQQPYQSQPYGNEPQMHGMAPMATGGKLYNPDDPSTFPDAMLADSAPLGVPTPPPGAGVPQSTPSPVGSHPQAHPTSYLPTPY